jgi:hypothetical protein
MECSEPDCVKPVVARGWCRMHYSRWYKHGDVHTVLEAGCYSHGGASRTRGMAPEYRIWIGMKSRTLNPKSEAYKHYGAKGVTVHPRWLNSFANFLADVGPRPSPIHSIDRYPNRNGNYEPGNVRWATPKEQMRNTDKTCFLTIYGITKSLSEWAEIHGLTRATLYERVKRGIEPEDAIQQW